MNRSPLRAITDDEVARYKDDGAIMLPGLFDSDWVELLRGGIESALHDKRFVRPGGFQRARGLWFTEEPFRQYVFDSPASHIAGRMLGTKEPRLYFDQLFVKEPGVEDPTPWHQDRTYWPIMGGEVCSIWLALDHVTRESSGLAYVRGSHRDRKLYGAVAFPGGKAGEGAKEHEPVPDIDGQPDKYELLSWDMQPGDCLVHHSYILHGAGGNLTQGFRRRAVSTRWADEHVKFGDIAAAVKDDSLSGPAGGNLDSKRFPTVSVVEAA